MDEASKLIGMSWLQYGALGLLTLVLAAVGMYVRHLLNRLQDQAERAEAWMKELVEADRAERQRQTDAWVELVRASIEAQKATCQALTTLEDRVITEARARQLQEEVLRRIEQMQGG